MAALAILNALFLLTHSHEARCWLARNVTGKHGWDEAPMQLAPPVERHTSRVRNLHYTLARKGVPEAYHTSAATYKRNTRCASLLA